MKIKDTFYPTNRAQWRAWLQAHYKSADEIWLVYYRKSTGLPSLPYGDAVEEALCFGWIDSIRKTLDRERYVQRFTLRKSQSGYSQPNIERLRVLIAADRVVPEVAASVRKMLAEPFVYSPDILAALQANKQAWTHFRRYPLPYQRIRIAFVEAARTRPEEFEKRMQHLIKMTAQNNQYGYGIEAFY